MTIKDIMELADDYAESRHRSGCYTYNVKTQEARKELQAKIEKQMEKNRGDWLDPATAPLDRPFLAITDSGVTTIYCSDAKNRWFEVLVEGSYAEGPAFHKFYGWMPIPEFSEKPAWDPVPQYVRETNVAEEPLTEENKKFLKSMLDRMVKEPKGAPSQVHRIVFDEPDSVETKKQVTDEDVRNMIGRIESGQAEEEELVRFLQSLIPPRPIQIGSTRGA